MNHIEVATLGENPPAVIYAMDFSSWKRPSVRQCFPDTPVIFVNKAKHVPAGSTLLVWGMRPVAGKLAADIRILRIEDGFLRSVGLGADLIRPMSWVVDGRGIYYDATCPSDLEQLLLTHEFGSTLLQRARQLQERIVAEGVTKYNLGVASWQRPVNVDRVLLVPGQVESDASLAYGAPHICTNMALLRAVRQANPDAYIIYKPHPDVLAGLRIKGKGEEDASRWCDIQLNEVAMGELLREVDEVHVLTSLAGFEALLRGKPVTCYGQPFYSGWGLTQDLHPNPRRERRLQLDELVAGALIEYPLYFSRHSAALISPEEALDELLAWRARDSGKAPWWRLLFRWVLRLEMGMK